MDIKVGEYTINLNRLIIGQVIEIDNKRQEAAIRIIGKNIEIQTGFWNIRKHSKSIIDLIEIGDIVEIELSEEFVEREDKIVLTRIGDVYTKELLQRDIDNGIINRIQSILTHEQYNQNCYRLEKVEEESEENV